MNPDIREILAAWPHDPESPEKNYRKIAGADGRVVLQVREPLGLQQMECDGRPDGLRPMGSATWLEHFQSVAQSQTGFLLEHDDCVKLMQEGVLFYQRYLILFQMGDWEGVVRDTERNLAYFEFIKTRAADRDDWLVVEQYRPYVVRMNAVARSRILWEAGNREGSLAELRGALAKIRGIEKVPTQVFEMESQRSLKHLQDLIDEYERQRPETAIERLRREQKEAIGREDFETAARIRDRIREIELDSGSIKE